MEGEMFKCEACTATNRVFVSKEDYWNHVKLENGDDSAIQWDNRMNQGFRYNTRPKS